MDITFIAHLERGSETPFVWWIESPQVPGLYAAADALQAAIALAKETASMSSDRSARCGGSSPASSPRSPRRYGVVNGSRVRLSGAAADLVVDRAGHVWYLDTQEPALVEVGAVQRPPGGD